jgi:hypothetical protein
MLRSGGRFASIRYNTEGFQKHVSYSGLLFGFILLSH